MEEGISQVLYSEYRNQGYTESEAFARCKAFEARYQSERKPHDPYDFADMEYSLSYETYESKGKLYVSRHRDDEFTRRSTYEPTDQQRPYQTAERKPSHTHHIYDQTRSTRRRVSGKVYEHCGQKKSASRYTEEGQDIYLREEYRSTRTSTSNSRSRSSKDTESRSSRESYYNVETRSPRTPMSGAQSPFSGSSSPCGNYFTEERRPQESSTRKYHYNTYNEASPRPARTKSDRPDYNHHKAAPPPRPSRTHTSAPGYSTTERKPRDIPREYTSGRDSPPPPKTTDAPRYATTERKPRDIPRGYTSGHDSPSAHKNTDPPRYATTERKPRDIPREYASSRKSPPPGTPRESSRSHHSNSKSYSHTHTNANRTQSPPPPTGNKPKVDLYSVLGVSKSASADEIKKAHRKLSMRWHPDRCTEPDKDKATDKMAEINQANDVLSDAGKRNFYDRTGCIPGSLDKV